MQELLQQFVMLACLVGGFRLLDEWATPKRRWFVSSFFIALLMIIASFATLFLKVPHVPVSAHQNNEKGE